MRAKRIYLLTGVLAFLLFCFVLDQAKECAGIGGSGISYHPVADTTYSSSWNGNITHGPTLNSIYDYLHLMDTDDDGDVDTLGSAGLTSIGGLTEADVSVIEATADNAYNVVTSGGNNYILGSNSGNTALEFKTPAAMKAELEIDTLTKSFTISAALATDDFLLWRTNVAITITDIYGVLLTGTNVVGGLDEMDANGANAVAVDADITFDGALDQDDGSLTNGPIDAGDWVHWHTTSVNAPGYLTVTINYTVD